jgi:hypothetical protein
LGTRGGWLIATLCVGAVIGFASSRFAPDLGSLETAGRSALSVLSKRLLGTQRPKVQPGDDPYAGFPDKPPKPVEPSFDDLMQQARVEAETAVDAFIERAKSGSASSQKQVVKLYCSRFCDTLPVEHACLVSEKYRTADNCSKLGLPMLRRLAEIGDVEAKWELASYLNSALRIVHEGIANDD